MSQYNLQYKLFHLSRSRQRHPEKKVIISVPNFNCTKFCIQDFSFSPGTIRSIVKTAAMF